MRLLAFPSLLALSAGSVIAAPPVALDDRLMIQLIAQEPAIVTPAGVFADVRDNVWAIESNTHFPPKDYKGHPTDRIFVFSGYPQADAPAGNAPGNAKPQLGTPDPKTGLAPGVKRTLFADGLMQAMSLTMTPAGKIYVVCRNEIVYFEDRNHDNKPDMLDVGGGKKADRKTLVRLDTKATYPHNGLNGASLSPDGEFLYFCLGLNTGFDYSVIGADGSQVAGGGEGGSVWRCTPAGGKVERIATGFWNAHDLTFDAFGRLFAVDNDPDDIGPCRLLDIIEGGDYGWKYKNGRKGVHPFTSWNGELPGTLPMVAPTGEAPSGILAYESDNWPQDYRGQLLVTSWGDHTIQRFELKEKGASFTSTPVNIIRGGDDFRPVGITQASDGSVFVTDWVDKSYTLHLKGKLWRIRAKAPATQPVRREPSGSTAGSSTGEVAKRLRVDAVPAMSIDELKKLMVSPRREIRVAAMSAVAASDEAGKLWETLVSSDDERVAVQAFWSLHNDERNAYVTDAQYGRTTAVQAEGYRRAWLLGREKSDKDAEYAMDNRFIAMDFPLYVYRHVLVGMANGTELQLPITPTKATQSDPFIQHALVMAIARSKALEALLNESEDVDLLHGMAARRSTHPKRLAVLPGMLKGNDRNGTVRRVALQWIGEDRLVQFKDNLPDALKAGEVTRDLLATYLAAQEKLNTQPPEPGKPPAERSVSQFAIEFLLNEANDAKLRKVALELIDPTDAKLPAKQLIALIEPMGLEAIKAVAWRDDAESQTALRKVAADTKRGVAERREAVLGLARTALASAETKATLHNLLFNGPGELRLDALRSLRGALSAVDAELLTGYVRDESRGRVDRDPARVAEGFQVWAEQVLLAFKTAPDLLKEPDREMLEKLAVMRFWGGGGPRPTDTAGWQAVANAADRPPADPEAGRRVFALATGGRCYVCHQFDGRGGNVGPDLSRISLAMDHNKLVESIVEPSKEIAPLYVSSIIELKNGDTISGVSLNEGGANVISIGDATGKRHRVKTEDIVGRREEKISIMPEGLVDLMSVQEFRDLIAYLRRVELTPQQPRR